MLVSQTIQNAGIITVPAYIQKPKGQTNKTLQNPFFPEVLRGIGGIIHQMRYSMLLSTGETEDEIYEEVERMVYGSYVDGIILLYSRVNDRIMNFLREESFPFVMVGKPYDHISEITHVDNDNLTSCRSPSCQLYPPCHTVRSANLPCLPLFRLPCALVTLQHDVIVARSQ